MTEDGKWYLEITIRIAAIKQPEDFTLQLDESGNEEETGDVFNTDLIKMRYG